ncbi:MAG TPA: PIG-L family deacetylase [Gemmatimonadaceae bacterium]|jgi:LmbE family N-acetylglucosaminyl deacetylase|nr:PIG-L family deacetylase [Gemmatimonadaceae bacterium]
MRALTAVFAHPDDETFATGGTIAKYAEAGVRCSLYTATDGDAGRASGIAVSSREELGRIRRAELQAACAVLGVATLECGGYPDAALAAADPQSVIGEIVRLIRQERPQVVLTFGPEGAPTGHLDHRAVCRLATSAMLLAGTRAFPDQLESGLAPHRASRLYYVTWPTPAPTEAPRQDGQPRQICIPVERWHARKLEAFFAHRTQLDHEAYFRREAMPATEDYFVAIGAPAPQGAEDLFAGLD